MIALKELTEAKQDADGDAVLEEIYSYIVKAADNQNLDLFSGESRDAEVLSSRQSISSKYL